MNNKNINLIVIAEDDEDDRFFLSEAFEEYHVYCQIQFVENGEEVFDFLNKKGKFIDNHDPLPDLVLLDINMPKKNGKEVLQEMKTNSNTKHIPILMISTSNAIDEINLTYYLGANSFIVKPNSYEGFLKVAKNIIEYWFQTVSLKAPVIC